MSGSKAPDYDTYGLLQTVNWTKNSRSGSSVRAENWNYVYDCKRTGKRKKPCGMCEESCGWKIKYRLQLKI